MHKPAETFVRSVIVTACVMLPPVPTTAQQPATARDTAASIVARIQRADYEGDRSALSELYEQLAVLQLPGEDPHLASRVRYWRGFALWRRALNGFSSGADPDELQRDLRQALRDFEEASRHDPLFVDANVGAISCLQNLAHLSRSDRARANEANELVARFVPLLEESLSAAPEHPRLLWVLGAGQWYNPPERGGGQALAVRTYTKGLELARLQKGTVKDPLEPSWGEPELLMNLALASLNQARPDLRAAEDYAAQALTLVPYWHSVRNTLLPQIRKAMGK